MNQVMLQLTLAIAMFTTTVVVGLLPLKLQKPGLKKSRLQSLLSCFAGGVFLGTSFLDIFPHVNETYARLRGRMGLDMSYPFPELFCCLGFFLVYLLEEVTLKIFGGHGHGHGDEENTYVSVSQEPNAEEPAKIARGRHDTDVEERHEEKENGRLSRNSMHGSHQVVANTHELFVEEYANAQSSTDDEGGLLRSITFAAAISFHSILEGFALGIQENITGIVTLFISLLFDKGIEAFSVGLQISRSNRKRMMFVVITIITYALMTPVGAMIGVALQEVDMDPNLKDAVMVVLEGLAGGTFVYITFFEVLSQERENDVSNLYQLAAIVCGFSVIASLQANEHFEILFA